jgi:pilus assembly protein Flp/PilA
MESLRTQARTFIRFLRNEDAATSIEYAIIAAGIAVAIVGVVTATGDAVKAKYETVQNALN